MWDRRVHKYIPAFAPGTSHTAVRTKETARGTAPHRRARQRTALRCAVELAELSLAGSVLFHFI